MDLGLGTLNDVKQFVLPALYLENKDTQYDSVLGVIAKSVAGRFEKYCDRKFGRVVGDQCKFDANRSMYVLPRYPVEVLTALELRAVLIDDWSDVLNTVIQMDETAGIIKFGGWMSDSLVQMRATWTGGYWYETQEPLQPDGVTPNPDYPSTMPEGATPLPDDLKGAWLNQIHHEFQLKDQLLPEGVANGAQKSRLNWRLDQAVLLPEVQNVIEQYRRYQIT